MKRNSVPLIVEEHPDDYEGYPFITLIQYRQEHILTIVDNVTDKEIRAYVLDLCGPTGLDEELIISIANEWYENHSSDYPLSFDFSKRDISNIVNPIYKKFNIDYVSRFIGPVFKFKMDEVFKIKRKRKKAFTGNVRNIKK